MFPYDPELLAAVSAPPKNIPDVIRIMTAIAGTCGDIDGLKWFNGLYLQVTQAVETRVSSAGGVADPAWLAELDVQFAGLYFSALKAWLSGQRAPDCWQVLFGARGTAAIARIQFALAGINAHINHDLPLAIIAACHMRSTVPAHDSVQYRDYTALNTTLDALVDLARKTLNVRLPGDALPPVSHLEDTIAAFSTSAARETAWVNAEALWHLRSMQALSAAFLDGLDGVTATLGKTLLVPVPLL